MACTHKRVVYELRVGSYGIEAGNKADGWEQGPCGHVVVEGESSEGALKGRH